MGCCSLVRARNGDWRGIVLLEILSLNINQNLIFVFVSLCRKDLVPGTASVRTLKHKNVCAESERDMSGKVNLGTVTVLISGDRHQPPNVQANFTNQKGSSARVRVRIDLVSVFVCCEPLRAEVI